MFLFSNLSEKKNGVLTLLLCVTSLSAIFKFNGQNSTIEVGSGSSGIVLATTIDNFNGTLSLLGKNTNSLSATSTESTLNFVGGVYKSGSGNIAHLTATVDPATTDSIILADGQSIDTDNGAMLEAVLVRGIGNSINGQPSFSSPIVLQDANAQLTLCIQSKLNQSVNLNGGTVIFGDDLALQDGVYFSGNGTLDLAYKSLALPAAIGTPWSGNLTFSHASELKLTGYTRLTGTWSFAEVGGKSQIIGSGNVLDLASGGVISVAAGHTLYLSDVHVKNLGAAGGNIIIDPDGGSIILSRVTLELNGSYEFNAGAMIVQGDNCTVIAHGQDKFNISGQGTVLTVDGVALLYDTLATQRLLPTPFVTRSGGAITYANGGLIRAVATPDGTTGNIEFSLSSALGTEQLQANHLLAPLATLTFTNTAPASAKSITLDGQGFYIQFNYTDGKYMILEENTTVILTNILLTDFDPSLIDFRGSGATQAKLLFGDNVTVSLNKDLTISSMPLRFLGNGTLIGNNATVVLPSSHAITQETDGKTLTIQDVNLLTADAAALQCLVNTGTMILQDATIYLVNAAGLTFNTGNLVIKNNVVVTNANPVSDATVNFTFASSGSLLVSTSSSLKISKFVNLCYAPDLSQDCRLEYYYKRHLQLVDPSATLWLDNCKLVTYDTGFSLDYGRLLVSGKTALVSNTTAGAGVELGSALLVELGVSGILDINGILVCTETAYPATNVPVRTLSASIIPTLTNAEVAGLSSNIFASLTTDALQAFTPTQIPQFTTAQIQTFPTSQIPKFTTAQIQAFTTPQIQAFGTNIQYFTTAQIPAFTTTQLQALTTAQIQALTTEQIAAFTVTRAVSQIEAFTTTQIPAFLLTQIPAFTTTQIPVFTTTQMAAFTAAQLAAFRTNQVPVITPTQLQALSTTKQQAFIATQVAALTTAQAQVLLPNFTTNQVQWLSTTQIPSISTTVLQGLAAGQKQALSTTQLAVCTTAQVQTLLPSLTITQIPGLTSSQIGALTSAQVQALTTAQLQALTNSQIQAFTTTQLQALTTAQMPLLTTTQVQALTLSQIQTFTTTQKQALTPDQVAVLTPAGQQEVNGVLAYGDAIVLKHKNYGSYLKVSPSLISGGGTNWHTLCCASTKPTDNSAKFFIEAPGPSKSRFYSAGTRVRSGDIIRLESVSLQGGVDTYNGTMYSNCGFWLYIEYSRFLPPVSTPRPPYQAVTLHYDIQVSSQSVDLGTAYRIYKNGASIGDVIGTGDDVYIVTWFYDGNNHPIYLGSSNLSYADGKEAYLYCDTTAGQPRQPPSFASNFLWTIAENSSAAYQSAVNVRWADFGFSLSGWPISGMYQW